MCRIVRRVKNTVKEGVSFTNQASLSGIIKTSKIEDHVQKTLGIFIKSTRCPIELGLTHLGTRMTRPFIW